MSMRSKLLTIAALILLTLSGCAREDANSDGNGPGNADGFGGRTDSPNTPESRDAAPGPLSETGAPSAPAEEEGAKTPEPTADH
jgi:hypothetical protein